MRSTIRRRNVTRATLPEYHCAIFNRFSRDRLLLIPVLLTCLLTCISAGCSSRRDYAELDALKVKIDELDSKINKGLMMKGNLENLHKEVYTLREQLRVEEESLGNKPNGQILVSTLESLASQAGLRVLSVALQPERTIDVVGETTVVMNVAGGCHEFGKLLEKITRENRLMQVTEFSVNAGSKTPITAVVKATACWHADERKTGIVMPLPSVGTGHSQRLQARFLPLWLAMAPAEFIFKKRAKEEMNEEIVRKERVIQQLQVIVNQVLQYERETAVIKDRLRLLHDLSEHRAVAVNVLETVVLAVPESVVITSLRLAADGLHVEGTADKETAVANLQERLNASPWLVAARLGSSNIQPTAGSQRVTFLLDCVVGHVPSASVVYEPSAARDPFVP